MQTLREGGFTDQEIDSILSHLNPTYAGIKQKEYIEREFLKMDEEIKKRRGTGFTFEEADRIKKDIESRLK